MYQLILVLMVSFIATLIVMPKLIKHLIRNNFLVKDQYKKDKPDIPTNGGIIILINCFFALAILPFFLYIIRQSLGPTILQYSIFSLELSPINVMILQVICAFGIFGLIDEFINIADPIKIVLPIFFGIPLLQVIDINSFDLPFLSRIAYTIQLPIGSVEFNIILFYIIVLLYILVAANLVNMHSGFNGLQCGLSSIILIFILIKSILVGKIDSAITIAIVTGTLLGLFWYNRYPSRVFEGNMGAMMIGAAIGAAIIAQGFLINGFIMLIPHTIDFLMFVFIKARRLPFTKYGSIREDGTIEAPNPFKMKFLFPYYFNLTEKQTVLILYGITTFFCIIALFVPY